MAFDTYAEFQNAVASEKVVLAAIEARKRLMGWTLDSGSIYKLTSFSAARVVSIEDSGTAYTESATLAGVAAGYYYHDRANSILYLRASDSSNPNSRFLVLSEYLYFSNSGISAPYDHGTWSGYEVYYRDGLKKTSEFGVELDSENQLGEALDGSGSIAFINDSDYWRPVFEKKSFNNSKVYVYSYNPELPITQAKILYRGKIVGKSYTEDVISFKLNDQLAELRAPVQLDRLVDIGGALIPPRLEQAFQRRLYGEVYGHRPVSIDQVDDDAGYALSGTVSLSAGSTALSGTGTSFLSKLSPGDELVISGLADPVTIDAITSDTAATIAEEAAGSITDATYAIRPERAKRYTNRTWVLAGHAIREPVATVTSSATNTPGLVSLDDNTDFEAGAEIYCNTEIVTIRRQTTDNRIRLNTNLSAAPVAGDTVTRLAVTNVRLGTRRLTYSRDYTYNATTARLTLDALAEFNVAPVLALVGTVAFASGSRTVTGTNTVFTSQIRPGDWVRPRSQSDWYEVLQVVSDTELHLRTASGYTQAAEAGLYKSPAYFDESEMTLSCDVLGATEDGASTGTWIKTAPQVVKHLLTEAGLTADIETSTFTDAVDLAPARIGLVVPDKYSATKAPTYRDVISRVNKSVFGSLIQTPDFKYEYHVLRPRRLSSDALRLDEADALEWSVNVQIEKIVKTVRVEYLNKEFDYLSARFGEGSSQFVSYTNDDANYLAKAKKEYQHESVLVDSTEATTLAQRLAFLFASAYTTVSVSTAMQTARTKVADVVDFTHEKLFQRMASTAGRKVGAVRTSKRDGTGGMIEFEDLANAFTQCGTITEDGASNWTNSPTDGTERFFQGYITDDYGMQDNDPETFGVSRIW